MTDTVRDIVVRALDRATGLLNRPDLARQVLGGGDLRFDALEMDSLSIMEMIMEIEDTLGMELDAGEVGAQETLLALVGFLQSRLAAGSDG